MSIRFVVLLLAAGLLSAGSSFAAPRTFVASYGNDVNTASNCSPVAPCRTFAAAMGVTDSGGEIVVLDSAGYGSVTIDKSVSIIAPDGVYAGLTAASGDVVTIATAGVAVTLKGLTIRGGSNGINMSNGAKLHVENCEISGSGIRAIVVSVAADVRIANSTIRDSAYGPKFGFGATVDVMQTQIVNNSNVGIQIRGGTTGTTTLNIADSVVTGSSYCIDNFADTGTTGVINVTHTTVTSCARGFHNLPDGTGYMTVSNSTAAGNSIYGFYNGGAAATFNSLGNNHVRRNGTDKGGTITVVSQD